MHKFRFGIMVPWANSAVESELPKFLKGKAASIHSTRLVPAQEKTELDDNFLLDIIDAVPHAWLSISKIDLNAVAFCCTSARFFNNEAGKKLENILKTIPIPSITAYGAIVQQLKKLNSSKILLVTPYPKEITQHEIRALSLDGFSVTSSISLNIKDNFDRILPNELESLTESVFNNEDAIVISCTGLYTARAIDAISQNLKRPCISSNSAIASTLIDISQ